MFTLRALLVSCMAALLLTGCPFPVLPGYQDTRENLEEKVPEFIKAGVTTREEVFLALGEPDAVANDESWVAYGSAYSQGGMGLLFAGGGSVGGFTRESIRYWRLIIQFDAKGIVTTTTFESVTCPKFTAGIDGSYESSACFDVLGRDISQKYKLQERRPDIECCKGHKGVCGCRAGKIVCCDNTVSTEPGCTCRGDDGILD